MEKLLTQKATYEEPKLFVVDVSNMDVVTVSNYQGDLDYESDPWYDGAI